MKSQIAQDLAVRSHLSIPCLLEDLTNRLNAKHNEASTHSLQQFTANLTENQLEEAGVPQEYWKDVRNLPHFVEGRSESAQARFEETAFLIANNPTAPDKWSQAFELTYGKSVDDAIAECIGDASENPPFSDCAVPETGG